MSATARRDGEGRITSGAWDRPVLRVDFAAWRVLPGGFDTGDRVIRTLRDGTVFDYIPLSRYRSMSPRQRLAWLETGEPSALLGPELGGEG